MKVTGRKTEQVTIDIDDNAIRGIVTAGVPLDIAFRGVWQSFLKTALGDKYDPDSYIDGSGDWYYTYEDGYGHYETTEKRVIRPATPSEILFKDTIRELEQTATIVVLEQRNP